MPAQFSLQPLTYHCLFGLLAVTGLRIGEALNLESRDVNWTEGVITIRTSKFGKSRLGRTSDRQGRPFRLCFAAHPAVSGPADVSVFSFQDRCPSGPGPGQANLLPYIPADRHPGSLSQPRTAPA